MDQKEINEIDAELVEISNRFRGQRITEDQYWALRGTLNMLKDTIRSSITDEDQRARRRNEMLDLGIGDH